MAQENLKGIEKPSLPVQLICLFLPFVLTGLILWGFSVMYGKKEALKIFSLGFASFFGLGKFIVFAPVVPLKGIAQKLGYSPYQLAVMVIYMDTMVAVLIAYNFHLLSKLYWIGSRLREIQKDCYYLLRSNKWMKKFAVIGIVLFVSFPVAGTGAIGAAFLAHLLGFTHRGTVFLTFIGSVLGSIGMAYGAVYFKARLKNFLENPEVFYSSMVLVLLLIVFASWKLRAMIQEQRQQEEGA